MISPYVLKNDREIAARAIRAARAGREVDGSKVNSREAWKFVHGSDIYCAAADLEQTGKYDAAKSLGRCFWGVYASREDNAP
jgi:hypothetical protein